MDEMLLKVLTAIFKETQGAPDSVISMWTVGQGLGLDRAEMENLSMELVSQGLLEIKSLSGKVALTETGWEKAQTIEPDAARPKPSDDLENFIEELMASLENLGLEDQARKDLEIDLATLQGQMTRSQRLPRVVEASLQAVKETLDSAPHPPGSSLLSILNRLTAAKE
ncbi:MAG: hypothetical protein JRI54_10030 [Deltaproteobacteria bacterium]|nr:hypothetical protein [Deltaproteobacteria bacterium]